MINQPKVNFYILPDSDISNRDLFVYRLVEKAYEQSLPLLILTTDSEQENVIDRLIWTAKPERFIAHEIIDKNNQQSLLPIVISKDINLLASVDFQPQVVIDLSHDGTPLNFPKIMLVTNQHAEILANARMKYQSYVNQGITPVVHKISEEQLNT